MTLTVDGDAVTGTAGSPSRGSADRAARKQRKSALARRAKMKDDLPESLEHRVAPPMYSNIFDSGMHLVSNASRATDDDCVVAGL